MRIQSLKFEGIVFGYEGHEVLFDRVDFDFPTDSIVWVKASAGSGRSSLLQLMSGLQFPSQGRYLINDQNVTDMSFEEFLPYRLAIGYGFDFGGLINNRTLLENVTLPLIYHRLESPQKANEKAEKYFDRLGIKRHQHQRPSLVPGGVRKLVCLIRALITDPQMLLLDDPTVGLAQETVLKYVDCIQELRKEGRAQHVFISSFDEKLMNCLEYKEILIDSGQIFAEIMTTEKKVVSL